MGCTEAAYTPGEADLGCSLRVECTPGRATTAAAAAGKRFMGEPLSAETGATNMMTFSSCCETVPHHGQLMNSNLRLPPL